MLGGAGNKLDSIPNYTLLILSYQQIQLDKLGWSTRTDIIKLKRLNNNWRMLCLIKPIYRIHLYIAMSIHHIWVLKSEFLCNTKW